ncbi:hypothetical protein Y032_0007g3501 [Ancylostoma ceylanicum]|uniref:SCP domain-containing protein n=1 Tax=Ancylostoma ceylanicum TaxID=53326 RepID=A0A016VMU7_9BILA|nr:hypothetical protein Y032_0007g3501 [Ancylostoma ceylanicum]
MCLPVANCPGAALTNDERDTLTNAHNLIRSQIALGSAPNWAGNLNAGKNIYMLKYDCALEEAAKNAMGGVCSQAIGSSPYGHNVQAYVTPLTVALPKAAQLQDAVQQWYAPVRQYGLSSVDNRFTDSRLQSFANLAHYQTTAFGCHYAKCNPPDRVVIGCMYNHPIQPNGVIYPRGYPCTTDADCTLYNPSTCNLALQLCMTTAQNPVNPTTANPATPTPSRKNDNCIKHRRFQHRY